MGILELKDLVLRYMNFRWLVGNSFAIILLGFEDLTNMHIILDAIELVMI
jgi:hypothetical protein